MDLVCSPLLRVQRELTPCTLGLHSLLQAASFRSPGYVLNVLCSPETGAWSVMVYHSALLLVELPLEAASRHS